MVFSSVPIYLDPPNWNQQFSNTCGGESQQLTAAVPRPPPPPPEASAVRPMSMAERARLAKIPQPEPALKCPRCDSTNTKFCYFNNYSLSQPRHFCKTCRRYWTRGGAMRNVPVGGGCRRNKRSKAGGSSSKSSTAATSASATSTSSTATAARSSAISAANVTLPQQLSFFGSLHHLADYTSSNLGLSFTGVQPIDTVEHQYHVGGSTSLGLEQWRIQPIQQFPFFGGLETQQQPPPTAEAGLYAFDGGEGGISTSEYMSATKGSSSGLISQLASVKMEDSSHHSVNLPREYLGVQSNDAFWALGGGNGSSACGGGGAGSSRGASSCAWTADLSGFNSCSSGNLL